MEGKDGRTEKATSRKRSKARRDGQVCVSPEVNSLFVLLLCIISLKMGISMMSDKLSVLMSGSFTFNTNIGWTTELVRKTFFSGMTFMALVMSPIIVPAVVGAIIANMVQVGPYFSTKALKVRFSTLNPVKGMKNLFSLASVIKLILSLLKITLVVFVVNHIIRKEISVAASLSRMPVELSVQWIFRLIFKICMKVTIIFSVIAIIDWCHKKYKHEKGLMMTKVEVKDERKQEEVNSLVKKAQSKKMREFSLMRMMSAVPNANVIITNPTHVAIALQYDPEKMDAPRVTAKGMRLVAQRIKKIAMENNIPIIERPPLARSLYKYVKLGTSIPSNFFEAIAEILAFLHKLGKSKKSIQ